MKSRAIWLILVGLVSLLFWFWVKPWIESPLQLSADYNTWIKPVVALVILVAIEGLVLLMVTQRYWRWGITIAASVPYFVVFGLHGLYWTVVPIAVLLQMYAGHEIHSEADERLKVNIKQTMRRGLPFIVTSILIMISFAFYLGPATQLAAHQQELSPSVKSIVERTVSIFASPEIKNLPPAQRQSFLTQVAGEVIGQFNYILKPYFKYLPPILAFSLFLVLQGLSFIFVWLATGIAALLFMVLKKSGFIRIRLVQKESEELDF